MGSTYQFSESTMVSIRVASSVLQGIGIMLSLLRLWFRLKIRRLWWEDAWSFIACICAILLLISDWMYLKGGTSQMVLRTMKPSSSLLQTIRSSGLSYWSMDVFSRSDLCDMGRSYEHTVLGSSHVPLDNSLTLCYDYVGHPLYPDVSCLYVCEIVVVHTARSRLARTTYVLFKACTLAASLDVRLRGV
ncbi:hypothetical protein JVU11DRAFT_264 [Chiua virens]|nr:hypothetical protein JVU11DRAFT_264 [Chiua virens]